MKTLFVFLLEKKNQKYKQNKQHLCKGKFKKNTHEWQEIRIE